jgi:hypothetical protein
MMPFNLSAQEVSLASLENFGIVNQKLNIELKEILTAKPVT